MADYDKPVLAFDSSLGGCVAAVLMPDGRSFTRALETGREQAAKLMPMIQETVQQAGIGFADLGLIISTIGPGSFTGLRIGLSAARALSLSLAVPLWGVTTFEAVAWSAVPEKSPCLVVLETKRSDYYVQGFDADKNPLEDGRCYEEPALKQLIASGDYILCGDALARLGAEGRSLVLPNPVALARIGLAAFLKNGQKTTKAEPLYLRGADVSISNKIQREIKNLPDGL